MSTKTTNYEFIKPELTDSADITATNENWDKIDETLKELSEGDIFIATYGVTTSTEIESAYQEGKVVFCKYENKGVYPMVNRGGSSEHLFGYTVTGEILQCLSSVWSMKTSELASSTHASTHSTDGSDPINPVDIGAVPLAGGVMTGQLTVIDNLNVNKTYDSVEYKSYVRPINYSIGNNGDYSTGLLHYKGTINQAQLMFNKDGVMLRDNVNAKAYQLFGQHNAATAATSIRSNLYTYGTTDMTAGTSELETGKLYFVYE